MTVKNVAAIPLIFLYFAISWGVHWEELALFRAISSAYLWDALYAAVVLYFYQGDLLREFEDFQGFIVKSVFIAFYTFGVIYTSNLLELVAPFKYLRDLFLQLVLFAPICEELVFRGAFLSILKKWQLPRKYILGATSLLFSLSHLWALLYIPAEFQHYIVYQFFYTLILGWVAGAAYLNSRNIMVPIFIHFIFNGLFYMAIRWQVL